MELFLITTVPRRNELRPTMIADFKTISEILKGELRETGTEPLVAVSKTLDTPKKNSQIFQLLFMDARGLATGFSEQNDASAISVNEKSRPEQFALF